MQYDIVICGGGLVGRSLACALAIQYPLQIAVIEAKPPQMIFSDQTAKNIQQSDFDMRSFALSYGNALFLEEIGIWKYLSTHVTPIKTIHVSDKGHIGVTCLSAKELRVPALGYIAPAPYLNFALQQALIQHSNIHLLCPATALNIETVSDKVLFTYTQQGKEQKICTKLVVAADGTHSLIRQMLNIEVSRYDYQQVAIVVNIELSRSHHYIAYERFTETGPLAFLPLTENRCGIVWTVKPEQAERILALSDTAFLTELQQTFGYRLGRLQKVGQRFTYPLHLLHAKQLVKSRVVLVGNAAHTLHPIAGQGFNLGLRDVAALTNILEYALAQHQDIGAEEILNRYAKQQGQDHKTYIRFTDGLVKIFANTTWPLTVARNFGLESLNIVPAFKKALVTRAMGHTNNYQ